MEFQQANSHASLQDEAFWMSCFKTSAVPNPVRYREKNHLIKTFLSKKFICAHQNPAQNSRAYNLNLEPQQGPGNQPTHPVQTHYGSASSGVQYHRVQVPFHQNVNGSQSKSYPTATSTSREQMVCSQTFVSPTAHHQQTGNIQNYRQNDEQQSFSAVRRSYNEQCTTRTASNRHLVSLQNQEYVSPQLTSAPHREGEANYSVNSNSYTRCYVPNSVQQETNMQRLKETAGPPQKRYDYHDEKAIARIENYLYESYPTGSKGHHHVQASSPPTGSQFLSEDKMKSYEEPTTSNFARRSNSGPTTPLHYVHVPTAQHMTNMVPQKLPIPRVTKTGQNHIISKADLGVMHFGRDAAQSMQLPPYRAVTLSTGVNDQNDSSTHLSPACASMRAVAVVQPLSQESSQVGNNHNFKQMDESTAPDKSLIHGENVISPAVAKKAELSNGFNAHQQSSNQKSLNIQHSAASGDGPVVSDSTGPQEMSQKQVAGEQRVPSLPQMSITSEVPQTQYWEKNKGETSTDPKARVTDLSSVQTTPWTAAKLATLIQDLEKAQVELQDSDVTPLRDKLKTLFWKQGSKFYHIISGVISLTYLEKFCKEHLTSDTVILSQLNETSLKQLQNYYVLKDGEVYSEPPYISSWLNVNEQVDDIDKEFGFSSSLYDRLHTCSQSDKVGGAPFEMPNKDVSQTELVPADGEENQGEGEENQDFIVKSTLTCPDDKGSTDSSDSYYSFKIKVLPPEEAKSIFEQIQKAGAQSMDIDRQPERVTESSMQGQLLNDEEVTGSDLERGNKEVSSIETFCCLEWWMETTIGSERPVKCNCTKNRNGKACTEKNPEKEEMVVQDDSKLCVIKLDSKGEAEEKTEMNGCNQNPTSSCSALVDDLCVDLTEDGEKPESRPEKGIDDSWSSILVGRESEDEDLSSSRSEIHSHNPHSAGVVSVPEEAGTQEPSEEDDGLARILDFCDKEFKKTFSSEQVAARKKRKKKRSHKFPEKPKTSRDSEPVRRHAECKVSAEATEEPSDSNVKKAELMLFGSENQLESISFGGRRFDVSPPKTLSVNLSKPLRHKSSVATRECTAKQMVHDTWRRSYLPIKMNLNGKLKIMTPASYPKYEEASKRKLKCRPSLAKKVKLVEEKMTEDVVPLKQPDQQRSGHDNPSNCRIPLKNSASPQPV